MTTQTTEPDESMSADNKCEMLITAGDSLAKLLSNIVIDGSFHKINNELAEEIRGDLEVWSVMRGLP